MAELKLVSYNIDNSSKTENLVKNILDLASSGASIFCLQEVRPAKSGEFIGDILLKKLGPGWQAEFFLTQKPYNSDYGLAMLWKSDKVKVVKFETLSFSKLAGLHFHEAGLELIQGHKPAPIQRGALIGTFTISNRLLRVANLHLDWQGWVGHRSRQLEELLDFLKTCPAVDAEIISGDFNTIGFFGYGHRFDQIKRLLEKEFLSAFPAFVKTTTHQQHLDHIFARNLKIKQAEVVVTDGSDHYPILASLDLS